MSRLKGYGFYTVLVWKQVWTLPMFVYEGRGICPLFSSPPRGIWQLKRPHRREFAIPGQKNG